MLRPAATLELTEHEEEYIPQNSHFCVLYYTDLSGYHVLSVRTTRKKYMIRIKFISYTAKQFHLVNSALSTCIFSAFKD